MLRRCSAPGTWDQNELSRVMGEPGVGVPWQAQTSYVSLLAGGIFVDIPVSENTRDFRIRSVNRISNN